MSADKMPTPKEREIQAYGQLASLAHERLEDYIADVLNAVKPDNVGLHEYENKIKERFQEARTSLNQAGVELDKYEGWILAAKTTKHQK